MYYVTIKNYYGQKIRVEVSKEIFDVLEDSRKQGISEEHQQRDTWRSGIWTTLSLTGNGQ